MEKVVNLLNTVLGVKLQASSLKLIRVTERLVACRLQLVAANSGSARVQLTTVRS